MSPLIPMTPQEQLALRLSTKRKVLRLTQKQLAERIGTSQTAIARLEAGHGNPTINFIQRVSSALDLEINLYIRPKP